MGGANVELWAVCALLVLIFWGGWGIQLWAVCALLVLILGTVWAVCALVVLILERSGRFALFSF
eukprot:2160898-Amphidinium_carterae.1